MVAVPIATNVQESRAPSPVPPVTIIPPCTAAIPTYGTECAAKTIDEYDAQDPTVAALVLKDGTVMQGYSFGAETKSISGECVFQTGM
ncbi:Carbamoyl-phosphate synthase [Coemansia sp. BCRC 34490]|nr:Carbamoyl-phosphate synthase [Coemansia sp. RSA 2049]KAJ2520870.1 Carbamoyl-phosphate synthase [Coemansia sp. RSA 1939]KAJ2521324.1 Carbamoyl-phosphate synthase [Coemansia sp. RSA 1939]KAJ2752397.1 Carbamoyl-phosphate synthase [Coemansia sp. BCRC 34490]